MNKRGGPRVPLETRFWAKVDKNGPIFPGFGPCWDWTAWKIKAGYGQIIVNKKLLHSHRVVLELVGRTIPPGMHVDHLCKRPCCVNPEHLRIVTPRQNALENNDSPLARNARRTHCKWGHEFTPENTLVYTPPVRLDRYGKPKKVIHPGRVCKACLRLRGAKKHPADLAKTVAFGDANGR